MSVWRPITFHSPASWRNVVVAEPLDNRDLAYPGHHVADLLPQLVEATASDAGRIVRVPCDIPIFITTYRKDVRDGLKLAVPTTMRGDLEVVRAIDEARRGTGVHGRAARASGDP